MPPLIICGCVTGGCTFENGYELEKLQFICSPSSCIAVLNWKNSSSFARFALRKRQTLEIYWIFSSWCRLEHAVFQKSTVFFPVGAATCGVLRAATCGALRAAAVSRRILQSHQPLRPQQRRKPPAARANVTRAPSGFPTTCSYFFSQAIISRSCEPTTSI